MRTYVKALNEALRGALAEDERVVLLGEDIADPYGGAFKVTAGLSTDYPKRVRTTPVSEGAIAGVAAGAALAGLRPIAEVMFGDFVGLCFDQLVNHIAKYEAMYNGKSTCPVIIRVPSGGHRGYGPTHSQSLEKHLLGVPHLRTVAASCFHEPQEVLRSFLAQTEPVVWVEHKLLYGSEVFSPSGALLAEQVGDSPGTWSLSLVPADDCTLTVVAYGHQAQRVLKVIEALAVEEEVFVHLLVPANLSPFDYEPVFESVKSTGSLLTVEEGTAGWSFGTEIALTVAQQSGRDLRRAPEVLASKPTVIGTSAAAENETLVGDKDVEAAIRKAAQA